MYDREGLFLLVNPGGSKLWRWRHRFDRKEKLMALGEYPLVNLSRPANSNMPATGVFELGQVGQQIEPPFGYKLIYTILPTVVSAWSEVYLVPRLLPPLRFDRAAMPVNASLLNFGIR